MFAFKNIINNNSSTVPWYRLRCRRIFQDRPGSLSATDSSRFFRATRHWVPLSLIAVRRSFPRWRRGPVSPICVSLTRKLCAIRAWQTSRHFRAGADTGHRRFVPTRVYILRIHVKQIKRCDQTVGSAKYYPTNPPLLPGYTSVYFNTEWSWREFVTRWLYGCVEKFQLC